MTTIKTEELSITVLTEVYNLFAERKIKKFSSKEDAVRRTDEILKSNNATIVAEAEPDMIADCSGFFVVPAKRRSSSKPRTEYQRHLRIEVRVNNPKRKNSRSFQRFALYQSGMTVGEYLDACVAFDGKNAKPAYRYLADLHWDEERGFITVWTEQLFSDFLSDRADGDTADLEPFRPATK